MCFFLYRSYCWKKRVISDDYSYGGIGAGVVAIIVDDSGVSFYINRIRYTYIDILGNIDIIRINHCAHIGASVGHCFKVLQRNAFRNHNGLVVGDISGIFSFIEHLE